MNRRSFFHFIIAIVLTLMCVGAYVAWFFMFENARDRAEQLLAEVARIEREDAAIASTKGIAASLDADEALLQTYFVSQDDIVSFLEILEQAGEELGSIVDVASVSPGSGVDAGRVILALQVEGSFEAVMRTLGAFEYGPHDMRVRSLALDGGGEDEGVVWSAATTFSVGLLPETP